MPRLYERKPDALRVQVTVPMSERALAQLRKFAEARGQSTSRAARELIEKGTAGAAVK